MSKKLKSITEIRAMSREEALEYLGSLSPRERLTYVKNPLSAIKEFSEALSSAFSEQYTVSVIMVAKNCGCGTPKCAHGIAVIDEEATPDQLISIINRMVRPFAEGKEPPKGVTMAPLVEDSELN